MKRCSTCHIEKASDEFNSNRGTRDGLSNCCRICHRGYQRSWCQRNREVAQEWNREYWHKRTVEAFGMALDDYEAMRLAQANRCAICQAEATPKRRLSIDHSHQEGHVRGLLCRNCNLALGLFGDDPVVLDSASVYLRRRMLKSVNERQLTNG